MDVDLGSLGGPTVLGLGFGISEHGIYSTVKASQNLAREGCRESIGCSKDIFPESYITKYTSIRR